MIKIKVRRYGWTSNKTEIDISLACFEDKLLNWLKIRSI